MHSLKTILPALLLAVFQPALADFSNAELRLHPTFPGENPFVLEITGTWPDDCHPGEQKPVVKSWDGESLVIEIEIVVIHVTCNEVPTPYRVLVDLSEAVLDLPPADNDVHITVRYGDAELSTQRLLSCALCDPPEPPVPATLPDPGLYYTEALDKQGLILARQRDWLAAYPLTYDAAGSSEWLFAVGRVHEDTFFGRLYELSGGQCLGCPPPDGEPQLDAIGRLTLLADTKGLVQMKVDDGPFIPYSLLDFGFGAVKLGNAWVADLAGRWALANSDPGTLGASTAPVDALPGVVNIERVGVVIPDPPREDTPPHVDYRLLDLHGQAVTTLRCMWADGMQCSMPIPGFGDGIHSYVVVALSPVRLRLTDATPYAAPGAPASGELVRID